MKYASRMFIDLIQGTTPMWVNWDPPDSINVGDYGTIVDETGEFEWEGNIYRPSFQDHLSSKFKADFDPVDPKLLPRILEAGDEPLIVKSLGVITQVQISPEVDLPDKANAAFKVNLQFKRKRAAVLVMHKPRYISLPNDERLIRLFDSMPELKGKYIITEVVSCAAYMMHLSDKEQKFSVTFGADGPALPVVNTEKGAALSLTWFKEAASGISRQGSGPNAHYMPLYRLRKPRIGFWERLFGRLAICSTGNGV